VVIKIKNKIDADNCILALARGGYKVSLEEVRDKTATHKIVHFCIKIEESEG